MSALRARALAFSISSGHTRRPQRRLRLFARPPCRASFVLTVGFAGATLIPVHHREILRQNELPKER